MSKRCVFSYLCLSNTDRAFSTGTEQEKLRLSQDSFMQPEEVGSRGWLYCLQQYTKYVSIMSKNLFDLIELNRGITITHLLGDPKNTFSQVIIPFLYFTFPHPENEHKTKIWYLKNSHQYIILDVISLTRYSNIPLSYGIITVDMN